MFVWRKEVSLVEQQWARIRSLRWDTHTMINITSQDSDLFIEEVGQSIGTLGEQKIAMAEK